MLGFERSVFLFSKNILHVTQRTLFSEKTLYLEEFRKTRLNFRIFKEDDHLEYEIQHSSIPKLVKTTKEWTLATTKSDQHIDLLRRSLKHIYENTSEIHERQDTRNLYNLGSMTMQLFHQLDLPDKALEVIIS